MLFEPGQDGKADDLPEWERRELSVTLDWQQACTVSEGIQEWLSFLESDIDDDRGPALHMELGSLTFDFYRQGVGQGPRMVCTVDTACGSSRQVILTRSEQASLAGCFSGKVMRRRISRIRSFLSEMQVLLDWSVSTAYKTMKYIEHGKVLRTLSSSSDEHKWTG